VVKRMCSNYNAYFQLCNKQDEMYITLYPPAPGGEKLTFAEIKNYLNRHNITLNNEKLLRESLDKDEITEIMIGEAINSPRNEEILIKISDNKMLVLGRFYPASTKGRQLNEEDLLEKLSGMGVKYGVNKSAIDAWLQNRQYCTDVLLAKGIPPEESRDAVIEYKFALEKNARPALREDGSVDFRQLDLINEVLEGAVLAVRIPEYEGKRGGINVLGVDVPPAKPAATKLRYGQNVKISENESVLTATCPGHVNLEKDRVVVYNVYAIKGDAGVATGNIDYDGSVRISGDVHTGCSVKATGNIFVDGVVEGASLTAGGQIAVGMGIHGKGRASVTAGGDISTKFIQECLVATDGKVFSSSILHSKISAKGDIVVVTGKGTVIGGELKATRLISAKVAGSVRARSSTLLEIRADAALLEQLEAIKEALIDLRGKQERLRQAWALIKQKKDKGEALQPDKAALVDILLNQISLLDAEIKEKTQEYSQVKAEVEKCDSGRIVIRESIHDGVKIMISNVSYYVRNSMRACQFIKDGFEIIVK